MIERKALIFNIQKYNMYDGPGVRSIVFFKGCPLRCKWCSNPESQLRQFQIMFKHKSCVDCGACVAVCPVGIHRFATDSGKHEINRESECIGCGKCVEACPADALKVSGEHKSISELVSIVEEDKPFYDTSGGGLTLGGGEALMQPEAVSSLTMGCKQQGINTAIETCGYARPEVLLKAAESIDYFLYDLKHMDPELHHEFTGVRNENILSNLKLLFENGKNVKIRVPLLKGVNDDEKNLLQMALFLQPYQEYKNFKGIDLLPYHKLGVNKYAQLDRDYPLQGDPRLTEDDINRVELFLKGHIDPIVVIRH